MPRRLPVLKTVQRRLRELITVRRDIGMLHFYLEPSFHAESSPTVEVLARCVEHTLQGQPGLGFREEDLLARGPDGAEWFVFLASPPRSKHGLTRRDLQEVERRVARELRACIRDNLARLPGRVLPPLRSGAAVLAYDPLVSLPLQIEEARNEARLHGEVSRLLDDQLSGLNHKIRTPLTTIKGVIEILRHDADAAPRFINTLEDEVERIGRLLKQFSLFTRIQSGLFDWVIQAIDVGTLLGAVVQQMHVLSEELHVNVTLSTSGDLRMCGAVEILEEAFRQILDNAIRYGARGRDVAISATGTPGHIAVTVKDRGPGIPQGDLANLFQPFYVVGQDPDVQSQGGGLGLCLARGVLDVHAGDLECDSSPEGTTITMRFPRDFSRVGHRFGAPAPGRNKYV